MTTPVNRQLNSSVSRFFGIQICVLLCVSAISWFFAGNVAGYSALLGAWVCLCSGWLFATIFFKHHGAKNAKKILNAFYMGEVFKLLLTGACFAVIFASIEVKGLHFFGGYITTQMTYWFAPWFISTKSKP